ncbi:hypothetical protein QN095_02200 [Enterobacter cloacae]|uniref:MrpH family fimbial adhesin n=1 Tax=Enterobacter cloacae TaxID=550 RepID=UPI002540A24D|nr:hypothetical protein [Enterobacter cloacae]WIF62921.1 hypothetical protein QN095_02200 [Enterobacter cloacae]
MLKMGFFRATSLIGCFFLGLMIKNVYADASFTRTSATSVRVDFVYTDRGTNPACAIFQSCRLVLQPQLCQPGLVNCIDAGPRINGDWVYMSSKSWRTVYDRWVGTLGNPATISVPVDVSRTWACMRTYNEHSNSGFADFGMWGCSVLGSPPNSCQVTATHIAYGQIALADVAGAQRTANARITCLLPATVQVTVVDATTRSHAITLSSANNFFANMTINGRPGNQATAVTVPGGAVGVNVPYTATLSAPGYIPGGNYSGNGVVRVDYP